MIGWAIGIDIIRNNVMTLGAASSLGLIAWMICLVALVGAVLVKRQSD
jgi:hypothetical protein